MAKEITITWRDENYGREFAESAFRIYADVSGTEMKKVLAKSRKAGYDFNPSRSSHISTKKDAAQKFVTALNEMGYLVKHAGAVPHELTQATEETSVMKM